MDRSFIRGHRSLLTDPCLDMVCFCGFTGVFRLKPTILHILHLHTEIPRLRILEINLELIIKTDLKSEERTEIKTDRPQTTAVRP